MSISDVLTEYNRIKHQNEQELNRRRDEIFSQIPELKALYEQLEALLIARPRLRLKGEPDGSEQIEALRAKSAAMLDRAGFEADYLSPIYSCELCRDTGFLEDATHCDCFKKRILEDKLDAVKLADDSVSFEMFKTNIFDNTPIINGRSQLDYMLEYKQISENFADNFPKSECILLFAGSTGLGKTYLSKCIMRRVIERGFISAYYTAYRLFSIFHQHRLGNDIDLNPIFEVPLLIVDDIGTEPMTQNVTREYFFDLLNERIDRKLHTIIVTNLGFHELKNRYDERIHSRLMDTRFSKKLIFNGKDIRYLNKI